MNESNEALPVSNSTPTPLPSVSKLGLVVAGLGLIVAAGIWLIGNRSSTPDLATEAKRDLERRNFKPLSGPLEALLNDPNYKVIPTQTHPLLGKTAPDFTLSDTNNKPWTLSENLKSGPVVLVFYYGYHCDHCVSQLFGIDKDLEKFREFGATVVAVSGDKPEITRERFKKFGAFQFPVLSDDQNRLAKLYGTYLPAPKPEDEGELMHGTFVINEKGIVVWNNRGDSPFTENRTLLMSLHRNRSKGVTP